MRLLIECTFVYNHPHINSGIQRVVRNISRELAHGEYAFSCVPIVYKRNSPQQIVNIKPTLLQLKLADLWQFFQTPRHKYWLRHAGIEQRAPFKSSRNWRRALYVTARLLDLIFLLPLGLVRLAQHFMVDRVQLRKLDIEPGDVLLLLDSSWHATSFQLTEKLKQQNIPVIAVVYDVIPITHPHFFDIPLVNTYQRWFEWVMGVADGILTISRSVTTQAREIVQKLPNSKSSPIPWFDHFYLGTELDLIDRSKNAISAEIVATFAENDAVYLAVSTVEPRKNQIYLLDAFELLWKENRPVALCIVGHIGWKCQEFVDRVRSHPEFGRRLFMHNRASDADLDHCYTHARALLCPSVAEGFGLPIVEAMQRGLRVMASDIPVFREIGGDFIAYFDLDKPASLAELVRDFENSGIFPASRPINEWRWINWNEAAHMLVEKIIAHLEPKSGLATLPSEPVTRADHS